MGDEGKYWSVLAPGGVFGKAEMFEKGDNASTGSSGDIPAYMRAQRPPVSLIAGPDRVSYGGIIGLIINNPGTKESGEHRAETIPDENKPKPEPESSPEPEPKPEPTTPEPKPNPLPQPQPGPRPPIPLPWEGGGGGYGGGGEGGYGVGGGNDILSLSNQLAQMLQAARITNIGGEDYVARMGIDPLNGRRRLIPVYMGGRELVVPVGTSADIYSLTTPSGKEIDIPALIGPGGMRYIPVGGGDESTFIPVVDVDGKPYAVVIDEKGSEHYVLVDKAEMRDGRVVLYSPEGGMVYFRDGRVVVEGGGAIYTPLSPQQGGGKLIIDGKEYIVKTREGGIDLIPLSLGGKRAEVLNIPLEKYTIVDGELVKVGKEWKGEGGYLLGGNIFVSQQGTYLVNKINGKYVVGKKLGESERVEIPYIFPVPIGIKEVIEKTAGESGKYVTGIQNIMGRSNGNGQGGSGVFVFSPINISMVAGDYAVRKKNDERREEIKDEKSSRESNGQGKEMKGVYGVGEPIGQYSAGIDLSETMAKRLLQLKFLSEKYKKNAELLKGVDENARKRNEEYAEMAESAYKSLINKIRKIDGVAAEHIEEAINRAANSPENYSKYWRSTRGLVVEKNDGGEREKILVRDGKAYRIKDDMTLEETNEMKDEYKRSAATSPIVIGGNLYRVSGEKLVKAGNATGVHLEMKDAYDTALEEVKQTIEDLMKEGMDDRYALKAMHRSDNYVSRRMATAGYGEMARIREKLQDTKLPVVSDKDLEKTMESSYGRILKNAYGGNISAGKVNESIRRLKEKIEKGEELGRDDKKTIAAAYALWKGTGKDEYRSARDLAEYARAHNRRKTGDRWSMGNVSLEDYGIRKRGHVVYEASPMVRLGEKSVRRFAAYV